MEGDNYKVSPWWTDTLPPNAKMWREGSAVLNKFNKNTYYIKYEIPAKQELKAWKGHAAEQFDGDARQYLPGGEYQLFIELPPDIAKQVDALPLLSTRWTDAEARYGFDNAHDLAHDVRTETLGKYEIETKKAPANSAAVAGSRAYGANERNKDSKP